MWDSKWREILSETVNNGDDVIRKDPTRNIKEIVSFEFEIEDPNDRLLYDEIESINIFQCIGHFLWITQGTFNLDAIEYYVPWIESLSSDNYKLIGAYGPRLFGIEHLNQIEHLLAVLDNDPSKRRAVASVYLPQFDQHGLVHEEIPCTLNLQYLIRQDKVQAVTYMRSQDALKVLPYDVFIFTMMQEYVKNRLKPKYETFELGKYNHFSGSFHVYHDDLDKVNKIISNNQTSDFKMPPMPHRDVKFRLQDINKFESIIRTEVIAKIEHNVNIDFDSLFKMVSTFLQEDYWKQFGYILLCYGAIKIKDEKYQKAAYDQLDKEYKRFVDLYLKKFKN